MDLTSIRRRFLNDGLVFVRRASVLAGVCRISLVGSIVTSKPNPKDIDFLVVVADDADLAPLARIARQLQGGLQGLNRSADVFLADERGCYIGRICSWRECRPGIRARCDALHCGRRPHLHDDLQTVRLDPSIVARPPVTVWPALERHTQLPHDVEAFLATVQSAGGGSNRSGA